MFAATETFQSLKARPIRATQLLIVQPAINVASVVIEEDDLSTATNIEGTAVWPVSRGVHEQLSSWLDKILLDTGTRIALKSISKCTTTSADVAGPVDYQVALLEAAAAINNIEQFTEVFKAMNLESCTAEDLIQIIRLALSTGGLGIAKETCELGLRRFPNDSELNRMSRIFAPPRITISQRPSPTGTRANTLWLKAHGDNYRGKWVALRAGDLIASAKTIDELVAITGDVKGTDIFILPIQ